MVWLFLSIAFSSLIFILFKLFHKFQVNNLQAIVVNYFTAAFFGYLILGFENVPQIFSTSWLFMAAIVGLLFITLFNVMAHTTQNNGVSVASIANKMSVIIPVIAAYFLYNDTVNTTKIVGLGLALAGIYLVSVKPKSQLKTLLFPAIFFVGSGLLDTLLKFTQQRLLTNENELSQFTPTAFLVAGILGSVFLLIKKQKPTSKNIIWGIALGIPNYFSILILLKALSIKSIENSVIFPLNNMGVVLLSTFLAFVFFKEKLSFKNVIGVIVSAVAIYLLAIS